MKTCSFPHTQYIPLKSKPVPKGYLVQVFNYQGTTCKTFSYRNDRPNKPPRSFCKCNKKNINNTKLAICRIMHLRRRIHCVLGIAYLLFLYFMHIFVPLRRKTLKENSNSGVYSVLNKGLVWLQVFIPAKHLFHLFDVELDLGELTIRCTSCLVGMNFCNRPYP